jgi:hypothetical protein
MTDKIAVPLLVSMPPGRLYVHPPSARLPVETGEVAGGDGVAGGQAQPHVQRRDREHAGAVTVAARAFAEQMRSPTRPSKAGRNVSATATKTGAP